MKLAKININERLKLSLNGYLASQCALLGGDAVYRARALSSLYSNARYNDDSICVQAMEERGVKNEKHLIANKLLLHPNPVSDLLTFSMNNFDEQINAINVKDINGKTVLSEQSKINEYRHSLLVGKLKPGVYIVEVILANGISLNGKFIKI